MKKNISILLIILSVFVSFELAGCKTFNGYYYNLTDIREEKIYNDSNYIFTKDYSDCVIDFVVKNNVLCIVEIEVKNSTFDSKYKIKHTASYLLYEKIQEFNDSNQYNWSSSSNLSIKKYNWCIVTAEFNFEKENFPCFEFEYENSVYCLCFFLG